MRDCVFFMNDRLVSLSLSTHSSALNTQLLQFTLLCPSPQHPRDCWESLFCLLDSYHGIWYLSQTVCTCACMTGSTLKAMLRGSNWSVGGRLLLCEEEGYVPVFQERQCFVKNVRSSLDPAVSRLPCPSTHISWSSMAWEGGPPPASHLCKAWYSRTLHSYNKMDSSSDMRPIPIF
jgi:hypothetical protein